MCWENPLSQSYESKRLVDLKLWNFFNNLTLYPLPNFLIFSFVLEIKYIQKCYFKLRLLESTKIYKLFWLFFKERIIFPFLHFWYIYSNKNLVFYCPYQSNQIFQWNIISQSKVSSIISSHMNSMPCSNSVSLLLQLHQSLVGCILLFLRKCCKGKQLLWFLLHFCLPPCLISKLKYFYAIHDGLNSWFHFFLFANH